MPLQRVPINNFRGGLNTRDSPFELQPNESPDLLNVTLSSLVGQLRMRDGMTQADDGTCPGQIDHCRQVVFANGLRYLMCSIAGHIYSCNSAGHFQLLFFGTGGVWDFAQMPDASGNDRVWCVNNIDPAQKWDGLAVFTSAWANTYGGTPQAGRILVWRDKMVFCNTASTPERVYLSKVGDPEQTVGAFDFIDIRGADDDLQAVVEMNVFADRLYLFKQRSVWVMTDPVSFNLRRLGEPGCFSRFQSTVCEDKLYFLNDQGIWSTGGVAIAYESGSINNWFQQNLNASSLAQGRVVATRDAYPRVLISLPAYQGPSNNGQNSIMIELIPHINFRRIGGRRYLLLPAFMLHTFAASALAAYKPTATSPYGIYGGRASVGALYQYFNGPDDAGTPIPAYWQSSWMAIQGEEPFERVRRLNVELSGDVTVSVFKDFNAAPDFTATLSDPAPPPSILLNGDFESDAVGAIPAHWGSVNPAAATCLVANDWAWTGAHSARVVNTFNTNGDVGMDVNDANGNPVTPGVKYSIEAVVKITSIAPASQGVQFYVVFNDASGLPLPDSEGNTSWAPGPIVSTVGVPTRLQSTVVAPAGAVHAQLFIVQHVGIPAATAGQVDFHVDSVSFRGAPQTYRFVRVRPESRGRFHSVKFSSISGGDPFQINVAEMVIRGGKEH